MPSQKEISFAFASSLSEINWICTINKKQLLHPYHQLLFLIVSFTSYKVNIILCNHIIINTFKYTIFLYSNLYICIYTFCYSNNNSVLLIKPLNCNAWFFHFSHIALKVLSNRLSVYFISYNNIIIMTGLTNYLFMNYSKIKLSYKYIPILAHQQCGIHANIYT